MAQSNGCVYEVIKKLLSKGSQIITERHRYDDPTQIKQLFPSFTFLPAGRIKRTMQKIKTIENQFP